MNDMNNKSLVLVDSHAHLDDAKYDSDRADIISNLSAQNIDFYLNVGESLQSSEASVKLAAEYDNVYATVGIHPHHADAVTDEELEQIAKLATAEKVVAVGEIGLDYYYDTALRENQKSIFEKQLRIAYEAKLPVVIHNRDSEKDCLAILSNFSENNLKGVIHCFSGSLDFGLNCIDMGFYISFAGQITFPKADDLREVVKGIPLEKMLIETDSPYLAPQAKRGKRNEPANVRFTAEKIAELKGVSVEEVASVTRENVCRLFSIVR